MPPGNIIDLSSNNGNPKDWNWSQIKANVLAVIVKATDGTGYVNPYYNLTVAICEMLGIPAIAYHFAEFSDVQAEAEHFLSVAGARARVLDSETSTDTAWQQAFLDALNEPADGEMDYGSASTLPRGVRALLWPASYGRDFGFGDAWQYTDTLSVPGIPGPVDGSMWIGSDADFDALFSIPPPKPSPPPPLPPIREDTMELAIKQDGTIVVAAAGKDLPDHLYIFTCAPGSSYVAWLDWTTAVAGETNGADVPLIQS